MLTGHHCWGLGRNPASAAHAAPAAGPLKREDERAGGGQGRLGRPSTMASSPFQSLTVLVVWTILLCCYQSVDVVGKAVKGHVPSSCDRRVRESHLALARWEEPRNVSSCRAHGTLSRGPLGRVAQPVAPTDSSGRGGHCRTLGLGRMARTLHSPDRRSWKVKNYLCCACDQTHEAHTHACVHKVHTHAHTRIQVHRKQSPSAEQGGGGCPWGGAARAGGGSEEGGHSPEPGGSQPRAFCSSRMPSLWSGIFFFFGVTREVLSVASNPINPGDLSCNVARHGGFWSVPAAPPDRPSA